MERIKIKQSTSSMLLVPLPTALPCFLPTVTRSTSGRWLGIFTKVHSLISPLSITNAVHLIARRSQFITLLLFFIWWTEFLVSLRPWLASVCWLIGCLIVWLVDWLVVWLIDWLIDWLICLFVDWLVGSLVIRLVDWLVVWFVVWLIG